MVITNIDWSDDLSIGIPEMDEDHKVLVSILNKLFAACSAYVGDAVLGQITKELQQYTANHFAREEKLLEENAYPSLEAHRLQHEELTRELEDFVGKIRTKAIEGLSSDVILFLREWLIVHIKEHDQQYAVFLKEHPAP